MVSHRNGACPRAAFVALLDMARFTRARVLRWVQHLRPVQLVLLPCGVHRTAACEWRTSGRGTWRHGEFVRPSLQSNRRSVGLGDGGELGWPQEVATGLRGWPQEGDVKGMCGVVRNAKCVYIKSRRQGKMAVVGP